MRVKWQYVSGKGVYGLRDFEALGWGSLDNPPEVGSSLRISGDYGINTSAILAIKKEDGGMLITTRNSIYRVIFETVDLKAKDDKKDS